MGCAEGPVTVAAGWLLTSQRQVRVFPPISVKLHGKLAFFSCGLCAVLLELHVSPVLLPF